MIQLTKLLLIILLFTLSNFNCYSEDDKIFLVSLGKEKIELTYFPIKFKEIIDNRYNKITIGNVQRGLLKKRWPATFELDMSLEVQQLFANSKLLSNKSEDYTIIVNSIWINEITYRTQEKGVVNLNFSIAKSENGNFVIISSQNIMIEEEVMDATTNHDSRIAMAFQKGLRNYQVTPNYKYLNQKFLLRVNNTDSIIYKTQKITKGIFTTPQDLAFNTPDTNHLYFKSVHYIRNKVYVRDELTQNEIQNTFAFSDGEFIFLNSLHYGHQSTNLKMGYMFDKIPLIGALNLFKTTVKNAQSSAALMVGMSIGFGILGSAIAGTANINEETAYILDLRYGTIMEFNKDNLHFLLSSFPELQSKFDLLSNEAKELYNTQIQFIKRMNELIAKQ